MKKWGKKDKHAMRVSYSRRIDRPNYQDLNPFREFLDKYTFQQGNPNLTPQYSNNYDVNYTFMGAMSIGANYSKTSDAITFTIDQDDAKKQSFVTKRNLATLRNYGFNLSIPVPVQKWWNVNANVNFFVNHYEGMFLGGDLDLKIPVLNLNIQNRFTLPKDWSAEVSGWYVSKAVQGLFVGDPLYAVNAGISKQLLDRRLTLRLNAQDIFWTQRFSGGQKYQNLDVNVSSLNDSRQVRMTASYRFGNQKVQQARRREGGANDEKNRINRNN
jgi:outer membrane receptor protein involved in Fe transport